MTRHLLARAGFSLAVVGAAILVAASPAHAANSTLSTAGVHIYYTAATGQTNYLVISRVSYVPEVYEFNDQVAISSTDPACSYPDPADATRMRCSTFGTLNLLVEVKDLNDTVINLTDRNGHLNGGAGNDTLTLGGGSGGWASADGGDGNDLIKSGATNDTLIGGAGNDTVSYAGGNDAVYASLSGGSGGRWFDDDTYNGIENVTGGGGADYLYGDSGANILYGGTGSCLGRGCVAASGQDRLYGYGGDDLLQGGGDNDTIYGGDGTDAVYGEDGTDSLYGEAGNDYLDGGPATDFLNGGAGWDMCSPDWWTGCEAGLE